MAPRRRPLEIPVGGAMPREPSLEAPGVGADGLSSFPSGARALAGAGSSGDPRGVSHGGSRAFKVHAARRPVCLRFMCAGSSRCREAAEMRSFLFCYH
mmetsp:Transcript_88217/g.254424  ORF Transcript_88217/g.254424 Transcript_88217/m.254424 type:complete len:98 (-) Transcript_88217:103-396(-)